MSEPTTTHMLIRTNAKGVAFIGRCVMCGEEGLPSVAATFPCPGGIGRNAQSEFIKIVGGDLDA